MKSAAWCFIGMLLIVAGCSTTSEITVRHESALYGYSSGDTPLVRWGPHNPRAGELERIRLSAIDGAGITGIGADGRPISARWGEFDAFGLEVVEDYVEEPMSDVEKALDKAMYDVAAAIFGAAYVAGCAAAVVVNPECLIYLIDSLD